MKPESSRTFEQAFDAPHLLHHLGELGVLSEQLLDVSGGHAGPPGHSLDPVGLPAEQLGSVFTVQFCRGQKGEGSEMRPETPPHLLQVLKVLP